jgi:hypothetical protein
VFSHLILKSDTEAVKPAQQPECVTESMWQSTPYTNLIRYKPSRVYFARFRLKGKLIRRSLKTTTLSVAKLRLADMSKAEQQKVESVAAVASGKMTFGDALAVFQSRMQASPALKPRTKEYCDYRISALLKSWPGLSEKDVSRITGTECHDWSIKNAGRNSSSSHNYTVSILKRVFAVAIEAGARYDNPATGAQRVRQRTSKQIVLPGFEKFASLVETVRTSGSGFAKPASELVQFLAYGGFRISESRHVTWEDSRFIKTMTWSPQSSRHYQIRMGTKRLGNQRPSTSLL